MDAFRAEVAKRMPSGTLAAAGATALDPAWTRRRLFGVNPQKQAR